MFGEINNTKDWLRFLMPFANEFANVFTQSNMVSIYKHEPSGTFEILTKALIDFIALSGIVWNVAYESLNNRKYPMETGILKGIILLIFAFLIPNLYMETILKTLCKYIKFSCKKQGIFIFGILVIIGLLALETISHHYTENIMIENLDKQT